MHESVLRDFFAGRANASDLRADLIGAVTQTSSDVFAQNVVKMDKDFEVIPKHLISLCDAVLAGDLDASSLETIALCLVVSGHFQWDGDDQSGGRVAETVHDWAAPDINYPLTRETVSKFRERLLTGQNLFTRDDITG